jgi:hypothetical protein
MNLIFTCFTLRAVFGSVALVLGAQGDIFNWGSGNRESAKTKQSDEGRRVV